MKKKVLEFAATNGAPYGAPLVAAKSSTFFLLPRPFVCYSRLLTVAR
jgi:hypothetical protein